MCIVTRYVDEDFGVSVSVGDVLSYRDVLRVGLQ